MRISLGVSEDIPMPGQRAVAAAVEDAGLGALWTNEATGRDALLVCQAWAAATSELRVGTGVVPLWTRSPAQLAMAAATLQEASGQRLSLGIGVSHPGTMEPWHGVDFRRPLTAARETLEVLDQLLAGRESDVEGDVRSSRRFSLGLSPLPAPPRIYLAAMGPRMLALAGRRADGVLLNWAGPAEVGRAGDRVRGAAGEDSPEVATYVRVAVDPDRGAARAALARQLGRYCALPAYAEHLGRQGFGDTVAAVKDAYRSGGPGAVPGAVDDDVLLRLGWYGSPSDDPTDVLGSYAEAGLDHLVARVVVVGEDPRRSVDHALAVLPERITPADPGA